MQRIPDLIQAGKEAANIDVSTGTLRWYSQARGEWGRDLETTLRSRFDIELVWLSCLTNDNQLSWEEGYNEAIEEYIDKKWGTGSLKAVLEDVQIRRQERYDQYFKENPLPDENKSSRATDLLSSTNDS